MTDHIVKNQNRNRNRVFENKRPEYERLGVTPTPFNPNNYAKKEDVGESQENKMVEMVSSVDGDYFRGHEDEIINYPKNGHVIDNNEFVNFFPPKMSKAVDSGEFIDLDSDLDMSLGPEDGVDQNRFYNPNYDEGSVVADEPAVGEYILSVMGNIIMFGKLEDVEKKVKNILYGEDIDFSSDKISQEDIVVLKRVELQVGVFIKD